MSLILDALNRADQERSEEKHAPSLHSSHSPPPTSAAPISRWIIEAAVLAILLIAVMVYSQWPSTPDTALTYSKPASAIVSTHVADVEIKPQQLVTAEPLTNTNHAHLPEKSPAVVQDPSTADTTTSNTTTADQPTVSKATAPQNINALYQQQTLQSTSLQAKEKTKPKALPAVVEFQAVDDTQRILRQIPLLADLSSRFQRSVPNIDYSLHIYAEDEGAGLVKLNDLMCKIGDEPAPGLRVIAILKESVVLEYQGTQFRLTALNGPTLLNQEIRRWFRLIAPNV